MPAGLRFALVVIALLGLSLALQAGLVAFAGYVLLGVYALSRSLSGRWIAAVRAERDIDLTPLVAGESNVSTLTVTNAGTVPVGWVLVEEVLPTRAAGPNSRLSVQGSRLKILTIPASGKRVMKLKLTYRLRGYYAIGPTVAETGDVFGLHRRHRVLVPPAFQLVLPKVVPLAGFDFASNRPVGEVRLANRLFEDPTRTAGVRPYQLGDPLQRVHWRATARTGQLHSRVYEPTTLAGATILLDCHEAGYPARDEPHRSDLAVTVACSIAYAVSTLNQQVGLISNGRDAVERIRTESLDAEATPEGESLDTRQEARALGESADPSDRLRPVVVDTRRGVEQFGQVREALARLELTDGLPLERLVIECAGRVPRDATLIVVAPAISVEGALALGILRKQGLAISAVLVVPEGDRHDTRAVSLGRLAAQGVRDVRFVGKELDLSMLGDRSSASAPPEYAVAVELA